MRPKFPRPTMRDTIEQLERTLRIEQDGIRERDAKIAILEVKLSAAQRMAQWGERLLDGVCSGMKEGSLPRRTHL